MKKHPPQNAIGHARSLRKNMTDAEQKLWWKLRAEQLGGYKFRRQVPLGNYIADFVCHEANLAVELDGGQHDLSTQKETTRTGFIGKQGYRVLRFWNHEVMDNIDGVCLTILHALEAGDHTAGVTPTLTLPHQGGGNPAALDGSSVSSDPVSRV